jgi:hypothetical protein
MDEVHPNPASLISSEGNVIPVLKMQHALLAEDVRTAARRLEAAFVGGPAAAGFSFRQANRQLSFSQDVDGGTREMIEQVALGQRSLALLLYPHLRPRYGWIDELGVNSPQMRCSGAAAIRRLCWTNIVGPDCVELLGADFLLAAPGWRCEPLDDGGMMYTVTESYVDWLNLKGEEHLAHFRRKIPKMKIYRARPIP